MATAQIDKFLTQASVSGEYDSTGFFRIRPGRAHDRLGSDFAQQYPGGYLLKVVQAGVLLKSRRLLIEVHREFSSVRLECEHDSNALEQLMDGLGNPRPRSEHPYEVLGFAMLAGLSDQVERVCMAHFDGAQVSELTIDHRGMRRECRPESSPPGILLRFFRPSSNRSAEMSLLTERCGFCPIPLTINGQRIDGQGWSRVCSSRPGKASRALAPEGFLLFEQYLPGQAGTPILSLPAPEGRSFSISEGQASEADWKPGHNSVFVHRGNVPLDRCGAAIGIPVCLEGPGKVLWVQHGVTLESDHLDLGCPGAVAVVEASGMKTDLSGFRVVRDGDFEEQIRRLTHHLETGVESVGRELPRLRSGIVSRGLAFWLGCVALVLGLFGLVLGITADATVLLVQSLAQVATGAIFVGSEWRENGASDRILREHVRTGLRNP